MSDDNICLACGHTKELKCPYCAEVTAAINWNRACRQTLDRCLALAEKYEGKGLYEGEGSPVYIRILELYEPKVEGA